MLNLPHLKNTKGESEVVSDFLGISSEWPALFDLKSISFDFFVNWTNNSLTENFFIKKTYSKQTSLDDILSCESNFKELNLAGNVRSKFFQLTFNEFEYSDDMDLYVFNKNKLFKKTTLRKLKENVIDWSGGPQYMGSKGLILATTELERGLSKTKSCWAGDCDCMLLDDNNKPIAIIEFQKRTTDIFSFKNNKNVFNELYNGSVLNQKKKFNRLKILGNQFLTGIDIPVFILHYHTNPDIDFVKVEKIEGDLNELKSESSFKIKFKRTREETFKEVLNTIILNS